MNKYRIFVEKLPEFQVEAKGLLTELNHNLRLNLTNLRYLNIYDLFNIEQDLLDKAKYQVFAEIVTDIVFDQLDLTDKTYLAVEFIPGQFDQRASSAMDCVKLIDPKSEVQIKSGKLIIFEDEITEDELEKIKKYYINQVESREKDLSVLAQARNNDIKPVVTLNGFKDMNYEEAQKYCLKAGLAMNADDLMCVVAYFKRENRDPYETELRILDTYWSDHCRHTTFSTKLVHIDVEESFIKKELEESLELYHKIRRDLKRENKTLCLMDLATIGARYLKKEGYLNDLEESEENNACSIYIQVDVDGMPEKWLLQFKNETHNHPTEIEPFGGASTCLGGAIRDPLSGRAYVFQAMRVTGAGDIYAHVDDTMQGKLPQRIISTKAAAGYSSYGNQIGLATTHVREVYHEDYVAKRLEVGAVVGAVKASNIRRESPAPHDVVIMLGGRTGRDGIGGATGSSKEHNINSIEECSSEVQKGNAPEERKIQRLFRKKEVTSLIKKANDFGAGGVSVAIGELADGLDIYLDRVPTKYSGLSITELAISESQERMAVVIDPKDMKEFIRLCEEENIEATQVAVVTNTKRLRMFYNDIMAVNIQRDFIDTAGAMHYASSSIEAVKEINPFVKNYEGENLQEKMENLLSDKNVVSQKGLIEMFDSTIGCSTVLMPFGGKYQTTETQVSVQKIPLEKGFTNTASMMAYGYNPYVSKWSPYHGACYSIVEAISKVVAAGGRYNQMRFSYQEYFERMNDSKSWGKPLAALLGALKMQVEFKLPSIGGKDSMSGTFKDINVPPMLMAFGITTVDATMVISPEFKKNNSNIYLIKHNYLNNYMPNTSQLKDNYEFISNNIENKKIISAYAVGFGGIGEALSKMAFGNQIGYNVSLKEEDLFNYNYGSIVVETQEKLNFENAVYLGTTSEKVIVNEEVLVLDKLYQANTKKFNTVYPDKIKNNSKLISVNCTRTKKIEPQSVKEVIAYLPIFPGTNCDYDTKKAFERAGATVITSVFCNLNEQSVLKSIKEMKECLSKCHIFAISGGFSAGDEPDGSGKFIANVLNNKEITAAVHELLNRKGLILGICNGFQALVKSGLLPYGRLGKVTKDSPTLFRNDINRHISQIVNTRVSSTSSPWLQSFEIGEVHSIAVSHGEGKFVVDEELALELFEKGQVAFQYVDLDYNITLESPYNPNGSYYAIEGIISEDGQILGKMGHTERYEENLFKNITGNKVQSIFKNAVQYFKQEENN